MTKKLIGLSLVSGAVLALAAPAMAKEPTGAAGASATSEATPAKANTKYCFNTETTGSRMTTKVCKTRAQWLAEGVDPSKPNADQ